MNYISIFKTDYFKVGKVKYAYESESVSLSVVSNICNHHPGTAFWTLLLTMMATPFLLRDSCPQ